MPSNTKEDFISSFYADDTSYAASDNPHPKRKSFAGQSLQKTLTDLENFCSKWRMGLNANKTNCIIFQRGSNQLTKPNLYLRNELLKYEKNVKFLGIVFDQELNFEAHTQTVYEKCQKRLNLLKHYVANPGEQTAKQFYIHIVPTLDQ